VIYEHLLFILKLVIENLIMPVSLVCVVERASEGERQRERER
jgi:hypothetical protein